jgi:endonuclease YncB( thermonuclease family)
MHDFKAFPELAGKDLDLYYFDSPHKQIFTNFHAKVVKVHDGDTISLQWSERDFVFPVRFINIAAPELGQAGGRESQSWLESELLGQEVEILINPNNRVEKWGRLLGNVLHRGQDMGDLSMMMGKSTSWAERNDGVIPDFNKELKRIWQ